MARNLKEEIFRVKVQLQRLVKKKGLFDEEVCSKSQKLDQLILQFMKEKSTKN